ncbi:hypothetical protein B0F90DRAFT_1807669 [Multifurca ochricompacta]|uniref:Cyclin n=1 Tax=Multifurca ochricompacta TaxID=376703 RepID=A0AAD4MC52_9AGAM|nr:hypothetical protein B0F90DRAFT_1807669 [Multifurca ochricompacta]
MPVPVPQYSRPPAHPVIKQDHHSGDLNTSQSSAFLNLTQPLPLPPPGPPPSFGTREEWISSLPLWRRNKPRRIWEEEDLQLPTNPDMQDFSSGLIRAGNAQIIKGDRAQACIPPLLTLFREPDEDMDDDIGSGTLDYDIESQWSGVTSRSEDVARMEIETAYNHHHPFPTIEVGANHPSDVLPQRRSQFDDSCSPTPEGRSPEPVADEDPASSPLGPITPFGVFVDRAVAASRFSDGPKIALPTATAFSHHSPYDIQYGAPPPVANLQYEAAGQQPELAVPTGPDMVSVPSVTLSYKNVTDPLAEWVAAFIWKVCTTGMSLNTQYTGGSIQHHSPLPPVFLANSIRSLLLSTLLQPSAVLLAVWYIIRLPVRFGRVSLRPDAVKEVRFRLELFATETHAPFRLVLLGCMLANKWLDDHTFSNKTWHTISGVPIQSLNRLESLALDIFSYDLSITPHEWNDWLEHVLSYHKSLSSAPKPQLISRPSSNPHFVVRKMIEDLVETAISSGASRSCGDSSCLKSHPQPVFLGLEERRRERLDPTTTETGFEALEIDLDEDGPLREEYMPRRRASRNDSFRDDNGNVALGVPFRSDKCIEWERPLEMQRGLPPPAKWSPAADEPLRRDGTREATHYMAIQAPPVPPLLAMPPYPSNSHGLAYAPGWGAGARAFHLPPPPMFGQPYDHNHNHVRSISVIDGRHCRSQSHTRFEYSCSSSAPKVPYQFPELCWTGPEQYGYDVAYGQGFGHRLVFPQYGPHWAGH